MVRVRVAPPGDHTRGTSLSVYLELSPHPSLGARRMEIGEISSDLSIDGRDLTVGHVPAPGPPPVTLQFPSDPIKLRLFSGYAYDPGLDAGKYVLRVSASLRY